MLHTQELSSTEARTSVRGAPPHAALQAHRDDRMPRSGSVGTADASRPHASRKSNRSISFPTAPAPMFAMALSIDASVLASMLSLHASLSEPLPEGASRFPGAISPSVMESMMRAFPFLQHLPCREPGFGCPLPAHKNGPARSLVRTGPEHRSDIMQPGGCPHLV